MKNLKKQIDELKSGRTLAELKKEDRKTYYKVQGLSSKLSEQKAYQKGQFVTKSDLIEYKNLIIWLMTKKSNYRGYLNLKEAMTEMLTIIENEQIVYKTKKGIKGIVSEMAIRVGLSNSEKHLRNANGITVLDNTYGNPVLESFTQFKLSALMN